eukprot:361747-Chlamydomonas_euryale.AAC.8
MRGTRSCGRGVCSCCVPPAPPSPRDGAAVNRAPCLGDDHSKFSPATAHAWELHASLPSEAGGNLLYVLDNAVSTYVTSDGQLGRVLVPPCITRTENGITQVWEMWGCEEGDFAIDIGHVAGVHEPNQEMCRTGVGERRLIFV